MKVLIGLFRGYVLVTNIAKSCTMTYQPGALREGVSKEAMALKCMGVGNLYLVILLSWIP